MNDPRHFRSVGGCRASDKGLLPVTLDEYLQLLDARGRIVREGKSGSIPSHLAGILERLGIRVAMWPTVIGGYDKMFGHVVGTLKGITRNDACLIRLLHGGSYAMGS